MTSEYAPDGDRPIRSWTLAEATAGSPMLTLAEIRQRYPSHWILLGDLDLTEAPEIKRARVLWSSPDRDELYRKAEELRPEHAAVIFTGSRSYEAAVNL
jgi:hypothetical protein